MAQLAALILLLLCATCWGDNLRSIPVRHGLVAAWLFDGYNNPSSPSVICPKTGRTATAIISKTLLSNGAWRFVSSDMDPLIGDTDYLNLTGSFSICAWVSRQRTNAWDGICGMGYADPHYGLHIAFTSGNLLRFGLYGDDLNTGTTYTQLNTWMFIAATFDAPTLNQALYVNGILVTNRTAASGLLITDSPLYVGSYAFGGDCDSDLHEIPIYNRALTADEIRRIYAEGKRRHL